MRKNNAINILRDLKMSKQILSKTIFLNYVNTQKATANIDVPFQVGKIVVKPIASYIDGAVNSWLSIYAMRSNIVDNEVIGMCGGSFTIITVGVDVSNVNNPFQASNSIIFQYKDPRNISGRYIFELGAIDNLGLGGTDVPVSNSFAVTFEFHEY